MNRSLKLSLLLALGLGSTQAAAVELGQIQIKSALGQPLLAEIPISPESPAELRNLSARLASPEDFARAGITSGRPLIPLKFSVSNDGRRKVIRITSAASINDPYLDLLIEVNSAAGKSVREFTVLLDPPGMNQTPVTTTAPSRADASTAAASVPTNNATPVTGARAPAASTPAARATAAAPGTYGPVERGQTLSSIARATAPAGTDANQMLLALKQANPDAFFRDNVNALKTGAVLRVPTSAQAQAMSVAAAMAEVRRQNSDWRNGATRTPTAVADAATGADTSSAPSTTGNGSDRLALVPPKNGGGDGAGGAKGDVTATGKARQDLLRNQEALTTMQQQAGELKSRMKDLEDINGKNERLIALKDNEIAELQDKLAKARKAANLPALSESDASAAGTAASIAATENQASPPVGASSAGEPAVAGSALAPQNKPDAANSMTATVLPTSSASAARQPVVAPTVTPIKKSAPTPVAQAPWYMQMWAWVAGAVALLVLLLLALAGRRRKPAVSSGASSLADRFGAVSAVSYDDAEHGGIDGSATDPAEDELLDQLAEHPEDVGLHLELASLYYSRRDVEHFEAAAEAMHAHIVDSHQAEWQDVVSMGEDLAPSHPLFGGADAWTDSSLGEPGFIGEPAFGDAPDHLHSGLTDAASDHASMDDPNNDLADASPPPAQFAFEQKRVSEYHFDFNLTPQAREEAMQAAAETATPGHDAVDSLAETSLIDTSAGTEDEVGSWKFDLPDADDDSGTATGNRARDAFEYDTAGPDGAALDATEHDRFEEDELASDELDDAGQFSDDPIDTKLDLARAYLDMGDADGARAMLEEVSAEGNQMQRDIARRLLDTLH